MHPSQISVNNLSGSSNDTLPSTEAQKLEDQRRGASLNDFPDGGFRAWSVVAGAWAANICSFGWINCIGVFQAYYQEEYLKGYSLSAISWIASLELSILFGGGFVVGRIYDKYGPRWLMAFGTFMHVFGLMMASLSTKYYQIILSQGICSPIGICCLFTPAVACVTTWFQKRRGLAMGLVSGGSSLGGVFLPIMFNRLIKQIGFPWAMKASLRVSDLGLAHHRQFDHRFFKPFTERAYLFTVASAFIYFLGLFVPINYIAAQAAQLGMSENLAQYLIPILNAASLFGRILPGIAADKFGAYNTQTIMAFFSAILVLALWLPASSNAAIIVFAALYGFGSGAFVTLCPTLMAQISPIREIGLRNGMQFGVLAIPALVSNPIGGAFIASDDGGYTNIKIWTGVILMAGACMYAVTRILLGGVKLAKKI
ncbi:MFS domain-containing protein [Fusarium sp. LHS14.1]|nr:MFS domain-containing protein [Fusarium sp. LHS14.1]